MVKYRIFTVSDESWIEHDSVGTAAINDPMATHPEGRQSNSKRQIAISEIIGVAPGDILFFNRMGSQDHPPEIMGVYEAVCDPYYSTEPLLPNAQIIKEKFPFRVDFRCLFQYNNPISMDEIWALKDQGVIWTLQQSRGDAIGRRACNGISVLEAKAILWLLKSNNIVEGVQIDYESARGVVDRHPMPLDYRTDNVGQLHYEAVLCSQIQQGLKAGLYRDLFGQYDDFISNVPTGARKEIDLLLLHHEEGEVLWYQVLELKSDRFRMDTLQKLIVYEQYISRTRARNQLEVHPIAIAFDFNDEVIDYVRRRQDYMERPIRLIRYHYDTDTHDLSLDEVEY